MRKNICVRLFAVLAIVLMLLPAIPAANAASETGSITVEMIYKKKPVNGIDYDLYYVGELVNSTVIFAAPYDSLKLTVSNPTAAEMKTAAQKLANSLKALGVTAKVSGKTASGKLTFDNLEAGVYLLVGKSTSKYTVDPALVSVPQVVNEVINWDVVIKDKFSYVPPKPTTPPGVWKTGQLWWPVWAMACVGLACVTLGVYVKKKSDRNA